MPGTYLQHVPRTLLLLQVDLLVGVLRDAGTDFSGGLACLGHGIGVEGFLCAGGALGAVVSLIATAQAGVAESAIATAVAGKLVVVVADLCRLLVDVHLQRVLKMLAGELGAGEDWRKGRDFERSGRVVCRNLVGGMRPLCVTGCGEG